MFLVDTLKKILSGQTVTLAYSSTTSNAVHTRAVDTLPIASTSSPNVDTGEADSYVTDLHQERNLSLNNGTVVGNSTGRITELLGSTQIDAFDGLPAWLPNLSIRLALTADEGSVKAVLCQPDGRLVELSASGMLETQVAVTEGKLSLRCEAMPSPAKGIQYTVTIV